LFYDTQPYFLAIQETVRGARFEPCCVLPSCLNQLSYHIPQLPHPSLILLIAVC
jgi:hypothetical protein